MNVDHDQLEHFAEALLRNRRLVCPDRGRSVEDLVLTLVGRCAMVIIDGDDAESASSRLDFGKCRRVNQRLIQCCVTPFGIDGPWADHYGGDLSIHALSGFMELTGERGRPAGSHLKSNHE